MLWRMMIAVLGLVLVGPGPAGCTSPESTKLMPQTSSERLAAISDDAAQYRETGDQDALFRLIEQLDASDPAVRLTAIETLERLTGRRLGYDPYADRESRNIATERWVQAARQGELTSAE